MATLFRLGGITVYLKPSTMQMVVRKKKNSLMGLLLSNLTATRPSKKRI